MACTAASTLVLCGPSGCGKTTVGCAVAAAVPGCAFLDADDFHPPANVQKMSSGIPLTDADRGPWLAALRQEILMHQARGQPLVLACSALKERYRRTLAGCTDTCGTPPAQGSSTTPSTDTPSIQRHQASTCCGSVAFVLLIPPSDALAARIAARHATGSHFMPPALLESQLNALEIEPKERWLAVLDDAREPSEAAAAVVALWQGQQRRPV